MKKIFRKTMFLLNLIFSGILLISYTASLVSPEKVIFLAFFALAYPYLLLANLIFAGYWILKKHRNFWMPILVICIGFGHVQNFIQFGRGKSTKEPVSSIRLMTYNVRAFDKYEWSKDKETPEKMIDLLQQTNADIFCFQEFYHTKEGILNLDNLKKITRCKYVHLGVRANGVALFSKHPIVKTGEIQFENTNWCNAIYADIQKDDQIVRIYNLHLESNRMGGRNYAFINKNHFKADEMEMAEIKDIYSRLKQAFVRRAKQAQVIRKHVEASPYASIVCGDFNDTAHSYAYHKIKGDFVDCFQEQGIGIGTTYSGDFPSFRIDFVLHDKKMQCSNYQRIKKEYSDHFPILTELKFVTK